MISPHEEFVFVNYLIGACLVSFCSLFVEIGRRAFLANHFKERLPEVLLDLVGASLVMKAVNGPMVDQDLGALIDYYTEHIAAEEGRGELADEQLISQLSQRVARYKKLRFSGASEIEPFRETRAGQ